MRENLRSYWMQRSSNAYQNNSERFVWTFQQECWKMRHNAATQSIMEQKRLRVWQRTEQTQKMIRQHTTAAKLGYTTHTRTQPQHNNTPSWDDVACNPFRPAQQHENTPTSRQGRQVPIANEQANTLNSNTNQYGDNSTTQIYDHPSKTTNMRRHRLTETKNRGHKYDCNKKKRQRLNKTNKMMNRNESHNVTRSYGMQTINQIE